MIRKVTMKRRAFRPGLAPQKRFLESGSSFEPAHRQRVHVGIRPGGQVELAVYDRHEQVFWIWIRQARDWLEIDPGAVEWWSQLPPKPRAGVTARGDDPTSPPSPASRRRAFFLGRGVDGGGAVV